MKLAWVQTPHDGSGAADFNGTREERIGASLCPNGVLYLLPSHLMSCRSRWASLAFACLSRVCTCDGARGCQPLTTANCRLGEPQLIVSSGCFYKALILIRYRCTQAFRYRHVHIIKCTLRFLMSPSVYVNKKSMLTSIFCPVNCILNWCLLEVDGQ